jgi:hypothetical protein
MNNEMIYTLIDSLQELISTPAEKLAERTVAALKQWAQPLAAQVKITCADKQVIQYSVGELTHLELLGQFEKKSSTQDTNSAKFNLIGSDRHIIASASIKNANGCNGQILLLIKADNPLKHLITEILELYAGNIVLALTRQSIARHIDIKKLLQHSINALAHLGVDGILAYNRTEPGKAFWMEKQSRKIKEFIPIEKLHKLLSQTQSASDKKDVEEITSLLPTSGESFSMVWSEFKIGGGQIFTLFAGNIKDANIIFSNFRNIIAELDTPTGYDEVMQAFIQLQEDHKLVVKGERVAAILEAAVAVNHEINNPLTAILGNAQLLLLDKDKLSPDILNKLNTIEKSAMRIRRVTQKLMAVVEPVTTPYIDGLQMLDLEKSSPEE